MENDIPRRLQGYLIKETENDWIIEDKYISHETQNQKLYFSQ